MTDKRKRAAPTIDLTATELSAAAAESKAQPQPDPPPQESAEKPEAPPPPPPEESRAQADAPTRRIGAGVYAAAIAAGFAGTALASAVFAALWFAGLLPAPSAASGDQRAQIAALKKQVDELQDRPAPAVNNQALDALRQSVRKLETDIAKLPPGDKTVSERLAAADNAMKSLGVALIALNKRSDDIAAKAAQAQGEATAASRAVTELRASAQDAAKNPAIAPAQLDALQKRVAALDQSVTAARAQIAKTSVTDTTARLALSAAALCDAVISGAPYQVELAQAKSLGADEQALAPLEPFAASGVPTRAALAHQLSDLIPAVLKASGAQKPPAGFFERLQTNASRLVRISPVSAPPGDNPSDVLARIEVQAAKADIADALTDLDKLSNAARAPAQAWIAKAKARQQALTAARQFASDAARALGKPPRGRAQ
jgi:hypothetical protein